MDPRLELLTTAQAARALHLHPTTVRRKIAAGVLPSVRVGRKHLIPLAAIAALIVATNPPDFDPRDNWMGHGAAEW